MAAVVFDRGNGEKVVVSANRVAGTGHTDRWEMTINDAVFDVRVRWLDDVRGSLEMNGHHVPFAAALDGSGVEVWVAGQRHRLALDTPQGERAGGGEHATGNSLHAPMPGTILKVHVVDGDEVEHGQALLVMESMKMEIAITSPRDGRIAQVFHAVGDLVDMDVLLVELEEESDAS